jgi:tetratricopeptide (TPR) repeat protein
VAAPQPTAPAPAAETAAPTIPEGQLAGQIDQRLAQLKIKKDLYAILNIPVGSGKDAVKTAFLTLAKVFHPDRLPASLPGYVEKMTLVFESIREAYETLYDDGRRAAYMSRLASQASAPPPPSPAGAKADDLMKLGEVFFRKRDYRQAEEHFAKSYAVDKKGNALAAQAWAIYMDPARKADAQKAKEMMASALKADQQCDRAHYQLGVIARVEGDINKAELHFKHAVQLNPRHLESNQELRLIEMRKKKAGEAKKGFFK